MTTSEAMPGGEPRPSRPWWWRVGRLVLIGNLVAMLLLAGGGIVAHKWATSSDERLERAIMTAVGYMLAFASLVEDQGIKPEKVEGALRLVEGVVIDGVGRAPSSDGHRYWQGRVLMAMPAVYKRFGRNTERVTRAERGIGIFQDLAARHPAKSDYRRRLAVTLNMHADDLADMGRHDASLARRDEARRVVADLLAAAPDHVRWRWLLVWAELGSAESLLASGRPATAAPHSAIAARIAGDLCREQPDDRHLCGLARRATALIDGAGPTP